jgi:hypothetical protein
MTRESKELTYAVLAELVQELKQDRATMTETFERFRSGIVNNVLLSTLATFDAEGRIAFDWHAPYGSVAVAAHGAGNVTVTNAGPAASAPTGGRGVHLVKGAHAAVINLLGTTLTLYGTAGEQVSLQVFTKPQPPAYGPA